ncbi:MAG: glycosyltransferase family 4 protein [Gemmatimonadota bacterium]
MSARPGSGGDGRIRVMHVCDKFGVRGSRMHGVSRLFSWWMPRFDAARFDVQLVHLKGRDESARLLASQGVDSISLGKRKFDPTTWTALHRLVRRHRPHVLHVHGYVGANYGRPIARLERVKLVLHEHAAFPHVPAYQAAVDRLMAPILDVGIAVSESTREFMVRRRFMRPDRIRVVFNGAPLDEFRPRSQAEVAEARRRWGLRPEDRIVGVVGRLDAQKGVEFLIAAWPAVLERHPEARLLLVGEGELMERHRLECRRLGVSDRVLFAGFATEIPLLQSVMEVQAFPSIWEGTPLTVFEAMAMGRPIVATRIDGLAEVLSHEATALLVPPRDPAALSGALVRLLDDRPLAQRLAAQAYARSAAYDVRRTVDALQEIYEELSAR